MVDAGQDFGVAVDYAHTPDALENVLREARRMNPRRLLVVFGCGGDRDRTKRPKMGRIAAEWVDQVFITSDNPRTERPEAIVSDIEAGLPADRAHCQTLVDRTQAIHAAIAAAGLGDLVVIAGKGHETYQILGRERIHFDDREVAAEALRRKSGN
jgi:UDP-N-acetylmuramoyl-L-alanyl-D-glutamate--2,6-diaminopimelate ligase